MPVDLKAIAHEERRSTRNRPVSPEHPAAAFQPRASWRARRRRLRFIQGDAAVDVRVGGTIEKPTLAGSLELNIPAARAENITVPAIRDFHARLAFTEKELRFERFNGEIGGGKINLAGQRRFRQADRTPPSTSLRPPRDVLAARDDNSHRARQRRREGERPARRRDPSPDTWASPRAVT